MITQVAFLCIVSLTAVSPSVVPTYASPAYEPVYESKPEPYSFAFDTQDEYGRTLSRKEEGDELGNKRGSYGYIDPYGIYRQVEYVADEQGFRAVIKTNEPGTESQNPANTEILSEAAPIKYDAAAVYGKAPVAAAYAKPVSVVAPAYAKPVSVVAPLYAKPAVAPATPLAPAASLAPVASLAPAYGKPVPAVYASAPAYGPAIAAYGQARAAYGPVPVAYGPVPAAYGPVPAAYGPVPAAYASSSVYEPLAPQSYAGPSYEQLSEKASQPTESRSSSE